MSQLHKLRDLTLQNLPSKDGRAGTVISIYFDDQDWVVRYFIVRLGGSVLGREILVPPSATRRLPHQPSSFFVALTRNELENAPPADSQLPVSRHYELQIRSQSADPASKPSPDGTRPWDFVCFGWPPHLPQGRLFDPTIDARRQAPPNHPISKAQQPHLHSSRAVTGYRIHARDGEIGHVEDFILEEPNWKVRYLAINTRNWLPGKHVLMPPAWVIDVNWALRLVVVDLDRETLINAPPYDIHKPIAHSDEVALNGYYGSDAARCQSRTP
ncbi:MAG: PRC-barrel domain-containing protein [Methylotetracoccus sp.]